MLGAPAYVSLHAKAAALLHSLARNHALTDGNKRLAWLAAAVFLDLNDAPPSLDDESAFRLVMRAAEGTADVDEIEAALRPS